MLIKHTTTFSPTHCVNLFLTGSFLIVLLTKSCSSPHQFKFFFIPISHIEKFICSFANSSLELDSDHNSFSVSVNPYLFVCGKETVKIVSASTSNFNKATTLPNFKQYHLIVLNYHLEPVSEGKQIAVACVFSNCNCQIAFKAA